MINLPYVRVRYQKQPYLLYRKLIAKKHKKSGSRYTKRANRQRTSTIDSMETVMDQQPLNSEVS
jgi:hypothetical protein